MSGLFSCRYYVGHRGRFGHEFLEFEFVEEAGGAGRLRYATGSEYKNESKSDVYIRKEAKVHRAVIEEVKRFVRESAVTSADDALWPEPDRDGLQELEVKLDGDDIFFNCSKIASLADIKTAKDPKTLTAFYYLAQDLKCLVFSLISVHFKIQPLGMNKGGEGGM